MGGNGDMPYGTSGTTGTAGYRANFQIGPFDDLPNIETVHQGHPPGYRGEPRAMENDLDEKEMLDAEISYHCESKHAFFEFCLTRGLHPDQIDNLASEFHKKEPSVHCKVLMFLQGKTVDGVDAEFVKEYDKENRLKKYPSKLYRQLTHKPKSDHDKPLRNLDVEDILEEVN